MSSLTMFAKIFRRCKDEPGSVSPSSTLQQSLKQALGIVALVLCLRKFGREWAFERLEKKEIILQEKIALEIERAKEFTKAKNRPAALQCLMRKKFYEEQIEHLGSFQMLIHDKEQKLQKKSSIIGGQREQITSNVNGKLGKSSIRTTLDSAL
ncbi:Vacuolar protein sorting-associated protein 32 like 1 [Dendrobium catenatum]|uniref:Vacuolar protein sorting-associated protein 32 like 1 n=1 Tax=Dendrobium catenatum TaxID=906689 RepID=A0A2I0WBZ8_9ASPA|nr:Vacuolar protein sorting-associated protein 32 like 1 [Dendrobium catenatum]